MRQPRRSGEPSKLGKLVLSRMKALGMERQVDLARRADISENTAGRIIWSEGYVPDRDTLVNLAEALHLDAVELVTFALDLESEQPQQRSHPLVSELDKLMHRLPDDERQRLETVVDAALAGFRTIEGERRSA